MQQDITILQKHLDKLEEGGITNLITNVVKNGTKAAFGLNKSAPSISSTNNNIIKPQPVVNISKPQKQTIKQTQSIKKDSFYNTNTNVAITYLSEIINAIKSIPSVLQTNTLTEKKALPLGTFIEYISIFINNTNNKSIEQYEEKDLNMLKEILSIFEDRSVQKLLKPFKNIKVVSTLLSVDMGKVERAIELILLDKSVPVIDKNTLPAEVNGIVLNAFNNMTNKNMVRQYLVPIVKKYMQSDDLTVYTWADIAQLIKIANQFLSTPIRFNPEGINMKKLVNGQQDPVAIQNKSIIIDKNTTPLEINGLVVDRLVKYENDVQYYLQPLKTKYGQINDITKYSWNDLIQIIKVLNKFITPKIKVNINNIDTSKLINGQIDPNFSFKENKTLVYDKLVNHPQLLKQLF